MKITAKLKASAPVPDLLGHRAEKRLPEVSRDADTVMRHPAIAAAVYTNKKEEERNFQGVLRCCALKTSR